MDEDIYIVDHDQRKEDDTSIDFDEFYADEQMQLEILYVGEQVRD